METLHLILLIASAVCFFVATIKETSKVDLTALGLCLYIISLLV